MFICFFSYDILTKKNGGMDGVGGQKPGFFYFCFSSALIVSG